MRRLTVSLKRLEKLEGLARQGSAKSDCFRVHRIAIDYLAHPDRMAIIHAARRWYGCNPPYEVTPELNMVLRRWATVVDQLRTGEHGPTDLKVTPL